MRWSNNGTTQKGGQEILNLEDNTQDNVCT